MSEFREAKSLCIFLGMAEEVQTEEEVAKLLEGEQRIAVPFCSQGELLLFQLESMSELSPGAYGILEPREELRELKGRILEISEIDFITVPALAVDRKGQRLGRGKGFYDRLLAKSSKNKPYTVASVFSSQIFAQLPRDEWDRKVDAVVTEAEIIAI